MDREKKVLMRLQDHRHVPPRNRSRLVAIAVLLVAPTLGLAPDDPREFVPTEEISADRAIALPVDI